MTNMSFADRPGYSSNMDTEDTVTVPPEEEERQMARERQRARGGGITSEISDVSEPTLRASQVSCSVPGLG
jgi:hypothetical protein